MFQLPKKIQKALFLADESTSRLDRKQVSLWKQGWWYFGDSINKNQGIPTATRLYPFI